VCLDKLDNQAGVDSAWQREKLEAGKILVDRAREAPAARPKQSEGTAPMMMGSHWIELVEIDHFIPEDEYLHPENSGMMRLRHHFIPKKLWRKYNAVSMNGDSPNESNGDDRCVRSPAENSGMRPYDLDTGGVRIVTFPSMFRLGLLDDT
jgi:hypothetical protein